MAHAPLSLCRTQPGPFGSSLSQSRCERCD